jgi:hypothetical protein
VLGSFEIQQLNIILKKFIRQVVTSKQPNNLEKLINIAQNLVKAHMSTLQRDKFKVMSDLAFHFVRSLFLDNVLENAVITDAILSNEVQCMADFENFTRVQYSPKFQALIDKLKVQIQMKQANPQTTQNNAESPEKAREETKESSEQQAQSTTEQEDAVIKQSIQTLVDQYVSLFQKAKIYEIKKLHKLIKQIANYVAGFIMKKETAPHFSKEK